LAVGVVQTALTAPAADLLVEVKATASDLCRTARDHVDAIVTMLERKGYFVPGRRGDSLQKSPMERGGKEDRSN
jgi:hypothetical protein